MEKMPENEVKIEFLREQVSLLKCKGAQCRYKCDSLILWSFVNSVSPHAYRFLRSSGIMSTPSPSTLSRLCNKLLTNPVIEQQFGQFMSYISRKVENLKEKEKSMLLLVDEIHLKSQITKMKIL